MDVNQRCRSGNNRTPRTRALGNALREARLDRDIGLRQFAKDIGRDASLLSRWETGDRTPTPTDVAQILGKLGMKGERYDEIIELAYGTDDVRWVATTLPEQKAQLAALLDYERTATVVTDVSPLLVPGLLQTSDYARAIMTGGGVPASDVSTRVTIRMGRREDMNRRGSTRFVALIGEAALRQLIGDRRTMVGQLAFLLEMAELAHIEIRVLPFDSGWHPGLINGSLMIESEVQPPAVYLEIGDSGLFLHTRPDVVFYRQVVDRV
ncbi:MAG TPA: helix-turn-helix transcriptional regulator, partial [Pseudonocardiaceae bacterium]|nr:helix-turn-helix transcriptional regulator [Pseudonocardiaceae bacterium]